MNQKSAPGSGREILFEMIQMGNSIKVIAVDAQTGTEATVICPVTASEAQMKQMAMRKLKFILEKQKK